MRLALAALVLAVLGCAAKDKGSAGVDAAVDAALPQTVVGKACASASACEGLSCVTTVRRDCSGPVRPHTFQLDFPGGYCNPPLLVDAGTIVGSCPAGSTTYTAFVGCDGIPFRFCAKPCTNDPDCRVAEGYRCQPELNLCVPPGLFAGVVDGGAD